MTELICGTRIESTCHRPAVHIDLCMTEGEIDARTRLAQAIEAKQSAVTMSEERLARALRAEDLLQLRAEISDDGELRAAEDRAKKAETKLELMSVELNAVYDHIGLKDSDRCPSGVTDAVLLDHNAIRLQKERADEAEARLKAVDAGLSSETACANTHYTRYCEAKHRAETAEADLKETEARLRKETARAFAAEAKLREETARAEKAEKRGAELERVVLGACTYCACCGGTVSLNNPEAIAKHVSRCAKHPSHVLGAALALAEENLRLVREEREKLHKDLAEAIERAHHYLTKAEKSFELRNEAEARAQNLNEQLCACQKELAEVRAPKPLSSYADPDQLITVVKTLLKSMPAGMREECIRSTL